MIPDPYERPTMSVPEAGRCFGLGRSASFEAVRRGDFPVETIQCGRRIVVATALVRRKLGLDPTPTAFSTDADDVGPRNGNGAPTVESADTGYLVIDRPLVQGGGRGQST